MDAMNAFLWLLLIPIVAAPVIYLVGRLIYRMSDRGTINPVAYLVPLVLLVDLVPLWNLYRSELFANQGMVEMVIGAVALRADGVSILMAAVVLVLTALVAVFSIRYMGGEENEEKYHALILLMAASMIGLCCAGDLFNLWVWFEAMAVSSYMLVAFYKNQAGSLEAGMKYLVQSSAGSVFVLLGIALVLSATGQTDLLAIRAMVTPAPVFLAAGALFMIGFGVKAALVPLHTWLPDAHSQAPSGVSALLSGVVIEAGLVALLRSVGALAGASTSWGALLLGFGAFNMLIGNLMALRQTQVKRLLAYSSIANVGYMLVGIGAAASFQNLNGGGGAFFHLINHALMKGLAFLAVGTLLYTLHIAKGSHQPLMLEDLNGASRRYPSAAFALSTALLALGGLPPLAGFMSKWQIFSGGFETGNTAVILLVIFAALNSVLSLGYYAPMVNRLYRHEPGEIVTAGAATHWSLEAPLALLVLGIAVIGFVPSLMDLLTFPAASSLLAMFGF